MFIRKSVPEDIPKIIDLWKDSFGDSKEYVEFFIKHRFCADFTAILDIDGEIAGMAHLLPCTVYPNKKAMYLYAVCIRKDFRNRGYFKFLVTNILKETKKLGFINLCVPVEDLAEVYRKFGLEYKYTAKDYVFYKNENLNQSIDQNVESASIDDFLNFFEMNGGVNWDRFAIEYAFLENELTGGKELKINLNGKEYPFFVINKGEYFLIDYHHLDVDLFKKIAEQVFDLMNCKKIVFRSLGSDKIVGLCDSKLVDFNSKISMTLG